MIKLLAIIICFSFNTNKFFWIRGKTASTTLVYLLLLFFFSTHDPFFAHTASVMSSEVLLTHQDVQES